MLFNQFGFRNSHTANHTSINLYGIIKKYLHKNYMDCGIFIDLKKSFNNCWLWYSLTLLSFNYYIVPGLVNNFLRPILKNRKQYIHFPGHRSLLKQLIVVFCKVQSYVLWCFWESQEWQGVCVCGGEGFAMVGWKFLKVFLVFQS